MKSSLLTFLSLPAALLLSGPASAVCTQQDVRGTWITYQSAFIVQEGAHVGQCRLVVDKAGNVRMDLGSYCEFVTFNTPQIATEGTFKVNRNCSADINLSVGGLAAQVQVTRDKQMYAGRFQAQDGAVSGTTSGVRQ